MKTAEQLKTRIKELSKQAVSFSHQSVEAQDWEQKRSLRKQALEASKRCQVLIAELNRRDEQL
jgi:hypothetical protein